jgi:hypothetical protein
MPSEALAEEGYATPRTTGGDHATRPLRPTPVLSRPRASGGGGYASETRVRRGDRVVHGDKELSEKLGRSDLCPCGSGRRFQEMLPALRPLRRQRAELLFSRVARATERAALRCALGSGAIGGAADSDSAGCRFDPCLPNHPASRCALRRTAEAKYHPKPWRRRAALVAQRTERRVSAPGLRGFESWLVSRFRSSPELAARADANFGIEGH